MQRKRLTKIIIAWWKNSKSLAKILFIRQKKFTGKTTNFKKEHGIETYSRLNNGYDEMC